MNNLTPSEFYLSQNYPNPFKDTTTIKFCVAYKTKVRLEVFDSESKKIKILLEEEKEAGTYKTDFDAKTFQLGKSGKKSYRILFYRFIAGNYFDEKEMIIQNKF